MQKILNQSFIAHAGLEAPILPLGKIKSFGLMGPKYQVGPAQSQIEDGDWMIEITLVETGEKTHYRYSHMIDDPEAQ